MPGNNGGSNFSGAAIDPQRGLMFVVSKDFPALLKLVAPQKPASGPSDGEDPRTIQYRSSFGFMITSTGLSAIAPPWTTMTAYDLNAGSIKWRIPLGDIPELAAKGIRDAGSHYPKIGPVVTAGGLIFTGARDRIIRVLDAETGKELWRMEVTAGIEGIPAIYEVNGRQYVVYCAAARSTTKTHASPWGPAAGDPIPGAYVALSLPAKTP
jgi:quinoprotein glucose dehydrogenase